MSDPLFLLDSDICIYVLEGGPPALRSRIEAFEPGEVVTSAIVFAEVMRGLQDQPLKREAALALFAVVAPLPFGKEQGEHYARLPFRRAGFDRLIAAHALSMNLTLVTNNERDFRDIPRLRIENWTR